MGGGGLNEGNISPIVEIFSYTSGSHLKESESDQTIGILEEPHERR